MKQLLNIKLIKRFLNNKYLIILFMRNGQSLLEIIIAMSILAILGGSAVIAMLGSFSTIRLAEEESQASMYALEGLEAATSIRNQDWINLTNGNHGVSSASGKWVFSGTSDNPGKFNRNVIISDVYRLSQGGDIVQDPTKTLDPDTKKLTVAVSWNFSPSRKNTITLSRYLTNWQTGKSQMSCPPQSNCLSVNITGAILTGGNQLTGVTLNNRNTAGQIRIDRMKISWSGVTGSKRMTEIKINGQTPSNWSGSVTNGTTVILTTPASLNPGSTNVPLNYIMFNGSMAGGTFSMDFIMSDGTTKSIIGIGPL